jgi:hypothetical protein
MAWANITQANATAGNAILATDHAQVFENLNIIGGAWTSFTPSWTNLTLNNGTTGAYYLKLGKLVFYAGFITWGSTTSATATSTLVSIPATSATRSGMEWQGSARISDAGTRGYPGECGIASAATTMSFHHPEAGNFGSVNSTNPMTWTTNDSIYWTIIYEAAS